MWSDLQDQVVEHLVGMGNTEDASRLAVSNAWEEGWGRVEASPASLAEAIEGDYTLWSGR